MIASNPFGELPGTFEDALARVPARTFGDTDWVTLALKNCATYLLPAIASGKPYRIARAVRAVAHTPSGADVADVIDAACDSLLAGAYATHDSRTIAGVAGARPVIRTVLEQLSAESERVSAHPAAQREAVEGYLRLIELADKSLAQRLDTVGALAARIAATMHASPGVVRDADHGGRLHDVGMISVPRERGQKTHPVIGETFLRAIPSLAHLAPIVRSHHECFDGSGFPDGLRGEEIPLAARIINVAAAFVEAITEGGRHKPMSPHDACAHIALGRESKFDPAIVDALFELLRYRERTNRTA